jgi:hypothetical protein
VLGAGASGTAALVAAVLRQQGTWLRVLAVATLLSLLGPFGSAVVFRNSPDTFVPVATVLALLTPLGALLYSFLASPAPRTPSAS